jgi:hypothetical protein
MPVVLVRDRATRLAIATLLSVMAALAFAGGARAAIYWGGTGTIGAANFDGTNPNPKYFQFQYPGLFYCDVAVSDTHLYWGGWFGIWRVNFDGPATPTEIVPGLSNPCGIAIDGSYVYWSNRAGKGIGRAALDGSQRNDAFITTGMDGPCEVAVDAGFVYWADWRGIGRARLDGSGVEPGFIPGALGGCGLAVDAGHLYFDADGAIGRASLEGADVDLDFIPGTGNVSSIAVHGGHVYWADQVLGQVSSIDRATPGAPPFRDLVPNLFSLNGIAVDGRTTPPPLPLPSRRFSLGGKVRHDERKGVVTIDVFVPERGDLVVTTQKLGWKLLKGPEPPPWRGGSFRWQLKVWAGSGPASKRLRTQLRNKGWAKVTVRARYNEDGQLPVTAFKRVTLRKHVPR